MPTLEARGIGRDFTEGGRSRTVLRDVSLTVDRGEIVALVGPSGSGKTTLLFILGCLLTPTSGWVAIDGEGVNPARGDRLRGVRRRSVGFVFQDYHLLPALNVLENVEYALRLKGHGPGASRREATHLVERLGLGERRFARPRDLSGGEKQRTAIARALAGSAPIILADEPTSNVDAEIGGQILDLFQQIARREGRAVLIGTHDPAAWNLADRIVRIQRGSLSSLR